jgi:phospholipase C
MKLFPSFREKKRIGRHVSPYRKFDNDCRRGNLPPVVFIDGNANAFRNHPGGHNNDDQAPADVARGQELVGEVYESLRRHGQLAKTMFIVTYDEHGGFFDHVSPPDLPTYARRHDPWFTTLGVRVPALVVSPYVDAKSVWCKPLSHPSITHTILLRFCPDQEMTARVHIAPNLGALLTRETARELPSARSEVRMARRARSYRHIEDLDPEARLTIDVLRELRTGGL